MNPGSPYNSLTGLVKQSFFFLNRVWPAECYHCGKEGDWFCIDCQNLVTEIKSPTCPFCNKLSEDGRTCKRCQNKYRLNGNLALWYYEEPLKSIIGQFKYKNLTGITETFASLLAERIQDLPHKPDVITSVPSAPHKWRERGYNQSHLLAQTVANHVNIPYHGLLNRKPDSQGQVGLTRKERLANVTSQFIAKESRQKQTILIIDDVITTGATLNACATTLKAAGSGAVWSLTLAKD